ncbi:sensor histidine kinase [Rhizobacter sp. P5_C2]
MNVRDGKARSPGWHLLAKVVSLSAVFVGGTYVLYRPDDSAWSLNGPREGYYWSVAQYQLAFYRMRELVRVEAAGEPVDQDHRHLRADILQSKARILIVPSELTRYFAGIEGYSANVEKLQGFHLRVMHRLTRQDLDRESAIELLSQFEDIEPVLVRLANEVRIEEMRSREAAADALLQRRTLLWGVLTAAWLLITGWLVTLARSERKLRDAIRSKSNFLAMVSHELRSPLQDILCSLDVMERRGSGAANEEFVSRIRRAANALSTQLRDLLTLATGEAGRLEIRPEAFEAGALVRDVVDTFKPQAFAKGLELRADVPDDPVFVIADPKRILQVLSNLVSNAVKYTDAGHVHVTLHAMPAVPRELHLTVSDSGRGIASEQLPSLFLACTRLASLERGGREGVGIGLAIVHTVAAHLGGTVDVESSLGAGSCFEVRIPVTRVDEGTPVAS